MSPHRPLALVTAILLGCGGGQAAVADPGVTSQLTSAWEVLWHQSGTPTRVARWAQPIAYSIDATPADKALIERALTEVTGDAGVPVAPAVGESNLEVQVVSNTELQDQEPCVTYMEADIDTYEIVHITIKMRVSDVKRCIYHEAMHAMGLRGHPSGPTILSYFAPTEGRLFPLDKTMLRAWYSRAMHPGMNPLQAMPVLAEQIVCESGNPQETIATANTFLLALQAQMQQFALGVGDAPEIIERSGKETVEGVARGRRLMSLFLGDGGIQPLSPYSLTCQPSDSVKQAANTH